MWHRITLAAGILERDGRLLLVASRYPNHAEPLWNLPGGRQEAPETLAETVRREFREETGLAVTVGDLAYVAESFDPRARTHFVAVVFTVRAGGEPHVPAGDAHAVACAWVERARLAERLVVDVVREPLLTYLRTGRAHYAGYGDPGVTIEFAD